ncbi:sugar phosphate nucleotidyltransferase [Eubacterium ruminantium]|uniref:sugar phosphate nucleotidyltransferase n=1 Tax=Eubacterium ruminantium TaxID=42322 RepID=UPI00247A7B9D|nr:sugar phosphate nucleotidyltransferase [Eubacterium ruminantium]
MDNNLKVIILAAGKGTRMKSDLPKVVHKCMGSSMVHHVIEASKKAGAGAICAIVGYKADEVKNVIKAENSADIENGIISFALQEEQLGTGHAVKCAGDFIKGKGNVIVLCGDTPLITGETLKKLYEKHVEEGNGVTVLSAIFDDPSGYGRIIRDESGAFLAITEDKDCTEEQKKIQEINSGMYIFDEEMLYKALDEIKNDNAQGEYYLPDAIEIIRGYGKKVNAFATGSKEEILGVNTVEQLKNAEKIYASR